ncbi:MAG: hypothetical protein CMO55_26845 [Verrucomicrobiales bacterium]|nr:hypothetical protein [Verrucomicrobiales bacterium]
MKWEEILAEARKLSQDDRATLLSAIIDDLGRPDYYVSDEEVQERVRQMESGEVEGITFDELKRSLGR